MEEEKAILMMHETRDMITEKICLVGQKIETLFANWRAVRNLSAGEPQQTLETIDTFYQPCTWRYVRKRALLQQHLE